MSEAMKMEPEATLEAVRRAHLLLVAAQGHFEYLLALLPPEAQAEFRVAPGPIAWPTDGSKTDPKEPAHTTPNARRTRSTQTLKGAIRKVVEQHPEGLTLPDLINRVVREYRSPRSTDTRHVVRTMINRLTKMSDSGVMWNPTDTLIVPYPF